jgi:protocatechuate 3,4-dioxygenase beta subunit
VELAELNQRTITDSHGEYLFRNMPSGTLTIRVDGKTVAQVSFGVGPQVLHQNIKLSPAAVISTKR